MKFTATPIFCVFLASILALQLAFGLQASDNYSEITSEELSMLAEKLPPLAKLQLVENKQARQYFIKQIKEAFFIAHGSQAEGVEKDPTFQKRLALVKERLLELEEANKSSEGGIKAPSKIEKKEYDSYLMAHTKDCDDFIALSTEGMKAGLSQTVIDAQKISWVYLKIRAMRGQQLGLDKTPEFAQQLKVEKARLIEQLYKNYKIPFLKPTETELAEYYTAHPEADPAKVKAQAESVLARLRKGESFIKLAKEFSADGSAQEGGKLRPFGRGRMVAEFEEAAFSLRPGQMSDLVKTQFGYHIIKVIARQKRKPMIGKDDATNKQVQELITVRHILIVYKDSQLSEQVLMQKKAKHLLENWRLKYPVKVPDDFVVKMSAIEKDAAQKSIKKEI